jgi:riboflavin kinase / FMN adenylyltransferase
MAYLSLDLFSHPPAHFTGGVVTVGNFDGVHRGHAALMQANIRLARQLGGPSVAVTFDPTPLSLLQPALVKPALSLLDDRVAWLHALGVDHVVALKTEAGLLSLSAESFVEDVLIGQFRVQGVVEGFNFRFGRGRAGDNGTLRTLAEQFNVQFEEVPAYTADGETVSSSRVREAINTGDVTRAAELLGRPYQLRGVVVTGAKRGRTIGFPTANLAEVKTLIPKDGVYAVRSGAMIGAMNIGPNPTFAEHQQKLEVHWLDLSGDLYGQELRIEFLQRLRDTQQFRGVEALVEQLKRDVAACRSLALTLTPNPSPTELGEGS